MHPKIVKANLEIKGWNWTTLAKEFGKDESTFRKVVLDGVRSKPVEQIVAGILEKPLKEVFPERYKDDAA